MKHNCLKKNFLRKDITVLNGKWSFSCNNPEIKQKEIFVPFCVESPLSGIGYKGFVTECTYEKDYFVKHLDPEYKSLLTFEAVDYECEVYVNDQFVGKHIGGYTRFRFDISTFIKEGNNKIKVIVKDDLRQHIASGKQSFKDDSFGCFYSRTTGIYSDVYIEKVYKNYINNVLITPHAKENKITLSFDTIGKDNLKVNAFFKGKQVGEFIVNDFEGGEVNLKLSEIHLWNIGQGNLYDLKVTFGKDEINTYFGLRDVEFKDNKFHINGQKKFQMLVLDQGFYKDGIYTPKDDKSIYKDIKRAMKLGFNGARLHQRVFPERYLYWADKLGFIVWQEYGSWGLINSDLSSYEQFENEWIETMKQTYNHPSIVTWCPLNETWKDFTEEAKIRNIEYLEKIYLKTKSFDPYRPTVDSSGGYHSSKTDINDFHCYYQLDKLKEVLDQIKNNNFNILTEIESKSLLKDENIDLSHLPMILSEFGGMSVDDLSKGPTNKPWSYTNCKSSDKFVDQYVELVNLIKNYNYLSGCCYTQLYDIEQERNGFYTFDRKCKFNKKQLKRIRECNKGAAEL